MRRTAHLKRGLQDALLALYKEPTLSGCVPAERALVCMPAAGLRSASSAISGQHWQLVQPRLHQMHLPATTPTPRQKRTKARASATDAVRLPKPALLEFAQQLERLEVAPSLGFSAREAKDSTPEAPTFEATVTLSTETFGGCLDKLQYTAAARSKKAAEHAASMAALAALAAAGQLGRPLALEVEAMQERAQAEAAAAAAQANRQAVAAVPVEALRPKPEHLEHLQAALGYRFVDVQLLRRACIHPSSEGENNNDRLALLGDRVLDLIVLQQGMLHRPSASNLELTTYKTVRVSRRQCTRYAQRLGLGPCIRTAFGFRRSDGRPGPEDSMLAEAFEAVLGAMYQDAGGNGSALEVVRNFWETYHPYTETEDH